MQTSPCDSVLSASGRSCDMHICVYICVCIHLCTMYVCMYVCTCVHVCIIVYTYNIYTSDVFEHKWQASLKLHYC